MDIELQTMSVKSKRLAIALFAAIYIFLVSVKPISLVAFYLLAIMGLFYIAKVDFTKKRYLFLFSLVSLLFVAVMALSILFRETPYSSFDHLGRLVYFIVAPLVATSVYLLKLSFKRFLYLNAMGVVLAALIALADSIMTGAPRATGMYNANTYADMLCVMAIVVAVGFFYFSAQKKRGAFLLLFALLAAVVGIVISGSRGALVTLFVVLLVAYALFSFFGELRQKKLFAMLFATLFILASVVVVFDLGVKSRIVRMVDSVERWYHGTRIVGSIPYRLEMYTGGLKAFVKHPILGYGYHAGPQVVAEICNPKAAKEIRGYWQLHNEYISALVNGGIVGYAALMALYLVPLYLFFGARRRSQEEKYVAMTGILVVVAYMVLGATHGEFGYEYETVFYVTTLSFFLGRLQQSQEEISPINKTK